MDRPGNKQKGSGKKISSKDLREESKKKKFGNKKFNKKRGDFKKKGTFKKKPLNKEDLDADIDKWWAKKDPETRKYTTHVITQFWIGTKLLDDELENYMQKADEPGQ